MIKRLFVAALVLAACTPTENESTAAARGSICINSKQISPGQLCVIQPSRVDARTKDFGTTNQGFGYHVLATPKGTPKGLWVHFGGSYGKPFYRPTSRYQNEVWLSELLGQGYMVVDLAYDNELNVNTDTCTGNGPGTGRDNCAGEVREETITGVDKSPYRQVDQWNGVDYRFQSLLAYLKANGVVIPASINPQVLDWGNTHVSGHSQGANVAYWLAKNRGVAFGCFLAGPFDAPDPVNLGTHKIADWFLTEPHLTPIGQMGAFLTQQDQFYNYFVTAYSVIGLGFDREWFKADMPPYTSGTKTIDGHAAAVGDPSLKPHRAKACFRG